MIIGSQKTSNERIVADMDKRNEARQKDKDREVSDRIQDGAKYNWNKIFNVPIFGYTFANSKYFKWDEVFGKKRGAR